jgi:hypothetical protein
MKSKQPDIKRFPRRMGYLGALAWAGVATVSTDFFENMDYSFYAWATIVAGFLICFAALYGLTCLVNRLSRDWLNRVLPEWPRRTTEPQLTFLKRCFSRTVCVFLAVIAIALCCVFGFRIWKGRQVAARFEVGARWILQGVLKPNHLKAGHLGAGGINLLWLGNGNLNVMASSTNGQQCLLFVHINSTLFSTRVTDAIITWQGRPCPKDPKDLTHLFGTNAPPRSKILELDEALRLSCDQWDALAATDPAGMVRVSVPVEAVERCQKVVFTNLFQ